MVHEDCRSCSSAGSGKNSFFVSLVLSRKHLSNHPVGTKHRSVFKPLDHFLFEFDRLLITITSQEEVNDSQRVKKGGKVESAQIGSRWMIKALSVNRGYYVLKEHSQEGRCYPAEGSGSLLVGQIGWCYPPHFSWFHLSSLSTLIDSSGSLEWCFFRSY